MDSSNLTGFNLKSQYTSPSIIFGIFFSHIIINMVLIAIAHVFSAYCLTIYEGHVISIVIIYFVCAYEFMTHVLPISVDILDLPGIKTT